MGANVNPREVEALPINGRQLSHLYLQAPGSVNSGSGTFGDIRFSGRANQQNVIRYDGVEGTAIIDASPGNINGEVPSPFRLQSSLENVQEFRVESNNFPAEFGTGTGGQVNVVTKSRGNQFHASVFEYFRNSALDAANFFDNVVGQKSPLRLNQFGGSIGGPIIKNRLFFFTSYEGYRLRSGVNSIEAVPGSASRLCAAPVGTGTINCNATTLALLPAFRSPQAVIIQTGAGGATTTVAQGFTAQLPGTISAANPLPTGFIAVVNTPGGGASRNIRRPNLIAGANPYLNNDHNLLNPAAFAIPDAGTYGNLQRNALRGPAFRQADLILNKRLRISESKSVEFRTEFLILSRLAQTPERVVTSEALWRYAWGDAKPLNSERLHVHIYRLRTRLAPFCLQIDTMVNVGYRLMKKQMSDARC